VYLLSHRYEALDVLERFIAKVEIQLERRVKTFRTDRGRKYLSYLFKEFCEEKGMQRELAILGTPQQNSLTERRNRALLKTCSGVTPGILSLFIKAFTIFYSVIKYYVRYSEIILMCTCLSTVFIEESIVLILFY